MNNKRLVESCSSLQSTERSLSHIPVHVPGSCKWENVVINQSTGTRLKRCIFKMENVLIIALQSDQGTIYNWNENELPFLITVFITKVFKVDLLFILLHIILVPLKVGLEIWSPHRPIHYYLRFKCRLCIAWLDWPFLSSYL